MAKDGPGGEKTEKPTPQRLKKARKEGQIPRTQELGTWLGVAAASALLPMLVSSAFEAVQKLFVQVGVVAAHPEVEAVQELLGAALTAFLTTMLPTAVGMMVVGTVASAAQGGVTFATKSMKPTLKKLNPFPGMKRMFGTQGLWEAVKALIKTAALGTVVIITSDRAQALVSSAGSLPLSAVAATFTDSAILMFRVVAVTGLIIAVADYVVVRVKMMKKLKMSKYEITQENKQAEGDPHMKGAPPGGGAVDVPEPDDERRRRGRRAARQPDARRRRAEVRPAEGRAAGGGEGSGRGGRPAARHRGRRPASPWSRTSRWRGPCTAPASSVRRCRRSCSPRWPACWPSSCTWAPAA